MDKAKFSMKKFFSIHLNQIIVAGVTLVIFLASLGKVFRDFDYRIYDIELGMQKQIEENPLVLFVDIDDTSLNEIGTWPWTRNILADALIRMKELGARTAIFDIEYVSPSTKAVDERIMEITENSFAKGEASITGSVENFARRVSEGSVTKDNASGEANRLVGGIDDTIYGMFQEITDNLEKDNDDYFGRAIQFFGTASLTINIRDIKVDVSKADEDYAQERFLYSNVLDNNGYTKKSNIAVLGGEEDNNSIGFVPALHKIIRHAYSAGFTNVVIDHDGARRRLELMAEHNGKYIFQLAFSPLSRIIDVKQVKRNKNSIVLYGALLPGEKDRTDIRIPLDENGCMLVNWMHGNYTESFRHEPVVNLRMLDNLEHTIYSCLYEISEMDKSAWSAEDGEFLGYAKDIVQEYDDITLMKKNLLARCEGFTADGKAIGGGLSQEDYDRYFAARDTFFSDATSFLEAIAQTIDGIMNVSPVATLAQALTDYTDEFAAQKKLYTGSICLFGNSATGSTDMGVTPFAQRYANLGTHGNVINTILERDFITPLPEWIGILFAFLITFAVVTLTSKKSSARKNVFGIIYIIIPPALQVLLMVFGKIYIPLVAPALIVIVSFIALLGTNFMSTAKEKAFIQQKFGAYVAPEVVSEIIKNPSYANIGGESKELTALFSDVKTFSGFTECINNEEEAKGKSGAERLVAILNDYLGVLSDAIMEQKGTIDKYVGDEIVSFFGAPVANPNHAFDACVAGIRMLQAEKRYNEEHLDLLPINPRTGKPFILNSRVGMNTGDMVVGNMGTTKKLNFTVMGNNVNLASRLEGTNKAYGSWIMCSESTWTHANSGEKAGLLVARKLDGVKVVNVEKPVRIYSILGLKNEMDSKRLESAGIFNEGIDWYMKGSDEPGHRKNIDDLKKAYALFVDSYRCCAEDESSLEFISRCANYISFYDPSFASSISDSLPPAIRSRLSPMELPEVWDGVYTMATK